MIIVILFHHLEKPIVFEQWETQFLTYIALRDPEIDCSREYYQRCSRSQNQKGISQ